MNTQTEEEKRGRGRPPLGRVTLHVSIDPIVYEAFVKKGIEEDRTPGNMLDVILRAALIEPSVISSPTSESDHG